MSAHRAVAALLAVVLTETMIGLLLIAPSAAALQDAPPSGSAVTVSGKLGGPFANLRVTVSQTRDLINQVVTVSWTGGVETQPGGGFGVNYLQIMQCWGDDPNGPDRTQCQYGGSATGSAAAGDYVRTRQLTYGTTLVDPKEELTASAGSSSDLVYVPFWAAGRPQPTGPGTGNINEFFDSQITNEISLARTRRDGTGMELFEVQTVRQAAGLGCGHPVSVDGVTKGRSCWLVIVPRGNTEVDGRTHTGQSPFDRLHSSPLSQSNWDHRMVVRLEFLPVGQACPIGAPERSVIGHELATDAVTSWQPALCAGGGALYSYTQLSDDVIRSQVTDGSSPGLALITNPIPIPPDQEPAQGPLIYAPVALSGLAIAFNVEHQPPGNASPEQRELDGQRFTTMKLTPRLVAKLITQSYQGAVVGVQDYLRNNSRALTEDPEFLELNPEYKEFSAYNRPPDALVQLDSSDLTSLLWSWVRADKEASEFLAGTPDPNGMVVNEKNRDLTVPTSTFPRNDDSCVATRDEAAPEITLRTCTLDITPFTKDMHDSGRSASRGDTQARVPVVGEGRIPTVKRAERQDAGRRALLAVVDAATATRYGLPTASLRNAAGEFVAPTTDSLLAGVAAMQPSGVPGVQVTDPGATDKAAYPLTALSYAVTAPFALDEAAGKDYATFLRYAALAGQKPGLGSGQLPLGMAPLPVELRVQTVFVAAVIEELAGTSIPEQPSPQPTSTGVTASPSPSPTPSPAPAAGARADSTGGGGPSAPAGTGGATTSAGGGVTAPPAPVVAQRAAGPATPAPSPAQRAGALPRTPSLPAPAWVGLVLLVALICGGLMATSSPLMHLLSAPARRRLGKEVTPPER